MSAGRARSADLSPEEARDWIGGAGPLVGTSFPCGARSTFTALSPLTGIFGDTNGGGQLGAQLKRAGFDEIVLTGVAPEPCIVVIQPGGRVSVESARELWGKDCVETDELLTKKVRGSMVACIGPAGESLVRFANVSTHAAGNSWSRTGVGAVLGSKKLKAIVVVGKDKIGIADPER